jgi:hypothetical protein
MNLTPQDFVAKWKRASARERQACQEGLGEDEILARPLKLNLARAQ